MPSARTTSRRGVASVRMFSPPSWFCRNSSPSAFGRSGRTGCNAVASTFGVLGICARKFAHRIPFVVKINHNELMTYPNKFEQIMFGTVDRAYDMGAAAVGATVYFGSDDSGRESSAIRLESASVLMVLLSAQRISARRMPSPWRWLQHGPALAVLRGRRRR